MEQFKNLGVYIVPEAAVRTAWELPWQMLPALCFWLNHPTA